MSSVGFIALNHAYGTNSNLLNTGIPESNHYSEFANKHHFAIFWKFFDTRKYLGERRKNPRQYT